MFMLEIVIKKLAEKIQKKEKKKKEEGILIN
jgi:hypothetical protein